MTVCRKAKASGEVNASVVSGGQDEGGLRATKAVLAGAVDRFNEILLGVRAELARTRFQPAKVLLKALALRLEKQRGDLEAFRISDQSLLDEIKELSDYVFAQQAFDEMEAGDWFVSKGLSYSEAARRIEQARVHQGKQRSARSKALKALQARERKLPWSDVAKKYCNCDGIHSSHCADRLRHSVIDLKKILKKYS